MLEDVTPQLLFQPEVRKPRVARSDNGRGMSSRNGQTSHGGHYLVDSRSILPKASSDFLAGNSFLYPGLNLGLLDNRELLCMRYGSLMFRIVWKGLFERKWGKD